MPIPYSHIFKSVLLIGLLSSIAIITTTSFAQTSQPNYQPGHQALEIWNSEGQANAPMAVRLWLQVMVGTFLIGLFFVWTRYEARWVIIGIILSILISRVGIPATGIPKLSGLVALIHLIFWSPGLVVLLYRRPFLKERSLYALWAGWVSLVILISFIFDIRDAAIYLDHISGLDLFSSQ